jgi:hypothetical protein
VKGNSKRDQVEPGARSHGQRLAPAARAIVEHAVAIRERQRERGNLRGGVLKLDLAVEIGLTGEV